MTGLILFSIYIISVLRVRRWIRIAYSKEGVRSGCSVDMNEIIVTFVPILNTAIMIDCMFQSPYMNGKDKRQRILDKFYGIKNN